jgi:L-ribulose-5-phosphate 3-epimerase
MNFKQIHHFRKYKSICLSVGTGAPSFKIIRMTYLLFLVSLFSFPLLSQSSADTTQSDSASRYKIAVVDLMILKRQKISAFKLTHTIGADGLEVDMGGLGNRETFDSKLVDSLSRQQFLDTAKKYNLQICALSMSGFYAQSFATREGIDRTIGDCIRTMKQMNVKVGFLPLGVQCDLVKNPGLRPAIVERLKRIGAMAFDAGVVIAIETSLDAAGEVALLKDIDSPAIKISFNFGNAIAGKRDLCKELEILGKDRICQIHCTDKDSVWLQNDPYIDMPRVKQTLDKMGWSGWLIVERSRDAKQPANVKANFTANTTYLKSIFQRKQSLYCENCLRYNDISYGDSSREKFDIIIPESDKPVPLVIYFYGGGFLHGDKSSVKRYKARVEKLLANGIAVASVNYLYRLNNDSLGVQRCINDAIKFVRYIRYHAGKYHIDKNRLASFGPSGGAGISLYLAFHDDMAQPKAADPLLRESTRLTCAGAFEAQSTYNVFTWIKLLPGMKLAYVVKNKALKTEIANFYGFPNYKSFKPFKNIIPEKLDMLAMISSDDPPVWIRNDLPFTRVKNTDGLYHHPLHAVEVGKVAQTKGVKTYIITKPTDGSDIKEPITLEDFFIQQLKNNQK